MRSFTLQRTAGWSKAELSRNKLTDHLIRCRGEIRASNRDTLLPVTLLCLRGQYVIERDALTRERALWEKLPGLTDPVRTTLLQKTDALLEALQTVIDGLDAKVFSTIAQIKDVRKNLLTQYRQPQWTAISQARADEAMTWMAHFLISLRTLTADSSLAADTQAKLAEAMTCLENAETALKPALEAQSPDVAREKLTTGLTAARTCTALIQEAQQLQKTAEEAQQ